MSQRATKSDDLQVSTADVRDDVSIGKRSAAPVRELLGHAA